jgi:hypothetical protein
MESHEYPDELSLSFSMALFSAFPEWKQFEKVVKDDETGADCMEVNVPQEGTDRVLHLSTARSEITIGFDHWHTHIGPFLGIDIDQSIAQALYIIDNFVAEQTIVRIAYRDGAWIGSSLGHVCAQGEPEPLSTTKFYSWKGTYDDVTEIP